MTMAKHPSTKSEHNNHSQSSLHYQNYLAEEEEEGSSGSGSYNPFTEPPFLETRDPSFITLIETKDEELTKLMMEEEGKFGAVSKTRRKRKNRNEQKQGQRIDFPQHPLLDTQRFAGIQAEESPVAADNPDIKDELLDSLAEQVEAHPELKMTLTNSLQAQIDLYNAKKHSYQPIAELKVPGT
jgi:hypothetical protein